MSIPPPRANRVLVVDDNAPLGENVAELFVDAGCRVRQATTPDQAIAMAQKEPFDLAVVDIRLPTRSGVELAAELRRACRGSEIILMTANASLDTAIAAVREDAFAYVQKPFDAGELLALGERALAQVQLRSERARLERELARSETLYRGVVDSVDSFIVGLDAEGRVRMWNQCAAMTTGWRWQEMFGQYLASRLASERSREQLHDAMRQALEGDRPVTDLELPIETDSGAQRVVRWSLTRFTATEGEDALVIAVGVDLTDRMELERRAAEAQAMAALGTLTAGLAHEIRNPLNAAALQLELLGRSVAKVDDGELVERMETRVRIVREELDRLTNLLNDFLKLAKPRAIERVDVDLAAVVAEVVELQRPVASQHGITIEHDLDTGPLVARGDAPMLHQVLVNLVVNAIDAMRPRGYGHITLGCHVKGKSRLELSVQDDGPGIPDEVRAEIFTPFVTSKEAGTGLGLTIVKRIIDRHGGTLHVSSRRDEGTVVRVGLERGGV